MHVGMKTFAHGLSRSMPNGPAFLRCGLLQGLGPQIQWVQSYVTGDKITCICVAPNAKLVRQHAGQGGFPANRVEEIKAIIDPTTAEVPAGVA